MNTLNEFFQLLLHADLFLLDLVHVHGVWVYAVLFAIVFCETGLIVTPFLPGDSLLFAAGTLVALGALAPAPLMALLIVAAIAGDAVNYSVGRVAGERAYRSRFVRPEYLRKTEEFFARHGGRTIIIARFVPIVRTFAPFTAGIGSMPYRQFATFNVVGAVVWVVLFVTGGWLFGNLPLVRENLTLVMLAIIAGSILVPMLAEFVARKRRTPFAKLG